MKEEEVKIDLATMMTTGLKELSRMSKEEKDG